MSPGAIWIFRASWPLARANKEGAPGIVATDLTIERIQISYDNALAV